MLKLVKVRFRIGVRGRGKGRIRARVRVDAKVLKGYKGRVRVSWSFCLRGNPETTYLTLRNYKLTYKQRYHFDSLPVVNDVRGRESISARKVICMKGKKEIKIKCESVC